MHSSVLLGMLSHCVHDRMQEPEPPKAVSKKRALEEEVNGDKAEKKKSKKQKALPISEGTAPQKVAPSTSESKTSKKEKKEKSKKSKGKPQ